MMAAQAQERAIDPGSAPVLAGLVSRLDAIRAGLDAPMEQIDNSFVSVGEMLTSCAGLLGQVTHTFEELPKDLESPELVAATGKLGDVIEHAADIVRSFDAEQVDLDALVSKVDAAHTPMAKLGKVIQMIGILAINARIVAASIAGERDEFEVFTTDITELSHNATVTIREFFSAYQRLSADVHRATNQRASFQAAQQDALEAASARLSLNLEEVTSRREKSAAASTETSRVTRDVGMRIGASVMAMQVGDSTRQRVEHVAIALSDVKALMTGASLPDIAMPDDMRHEAVASLLHLQEELLESASQDYQKDVVEAEHALAALEADESRIITLSRDLYGEKDHQGKSALGALNADLRQVAVMLHACEEDRDKLDTAAIAVGDLVTKLLGHVEAVQEIEGHMRLVTLNAAVRCAQLGPRGKALDVIAKQLRELTGATVNSAKTALAALNDAAGHARNVIKNAGGETSARISQLVADATDAVVLFEKVDQRLSAALKHLDEEGCGAHNRLGEAVRRFAGHDVISESLEDVRIEIVELISEIGRPDLEALSADESGALLLARQRRNYTMERERRVHDAIVGTTPEAPAEESPASDEDDLGLF